MLLHRGDHKVIIYKTPQSLRENYLNSHKNTPRYVSTEQQCWTCPAWSVFPQQPHSWGFSLLFVGPQVTCAVLTDLLVPDTRRGHWYSSHFLAQAVTTSAKDARPQEGLKVSSQSMAWLLRQVTTKPTDLHSSWYLSGQRVRHDD